MTFSRNTIKTVKVVGGDKAEALNQKKSFNNVFHYYHHPRTELYFNETWVYRTCMLSTEIRYYLFVDFTKTKFRENKTFFIQN